MAWIESHQTLRNHPKVLKAAALLNERRTTVIGCLHCLWWWALDYAQDGVLSQYPIEVIETAAEWHGESGALVNALLNCGYSDKPGFIESNPDGMVLHDWYEYAGKLIARRAANVQRMKEKRATHDSANVQNTCNAQSYARAGATNQTNTTVPNLTIPNQPNQNIGEVASLFGVQDTTDCWAEYLASDVLTELKLIWKKSPTGAQWTKFKTAMQEICSRRKFACMSCVPHGDCHEVVMEALQELRVGMTRKENPVAYPIPWLIETINRKVNEKWHDWKAGVR